MLPFLAKIGPILIPTQAVGWLLAYGIGSAGLVWTIRRDCRLAADPNFSFQTFLTGVVIIMAATIIGARVSAVLLLSSPMEFRWYVGHPAEIFKFWKSGFSFYGVWGATVFVGTWFGLRHDLPIHRIADLGIFWVILGHGIQNVGDFLGGNHPGSPTDLPWGVTFTHWASRAPRGISLHPFLLYIVSLCLLGLLISRSWHRAQNLRGERFFLSWFFYPVFRFLRLKFIDGEQAWVAGAVYAFVRFFAEFTRGPQTQVYYSNWPLPQSQMACIVLFCLCVGVYLFLRAAHEARERGEECRVWLRAIFQVQALLTRGAKKVPWRMKSGE